MSDQFESGFFVKEPAWHKLGTVVQQAPNTREAIRLAGLDWDVLQRPIHASVPPDRTWEPAQKVDLSSWKALVRSTDKRALSVVGNGYTPLQNSEAFAFFDPFLQDGDASLEAAGSLRNGRTIWVLAKLRQQSLNVGGFGTTDQVAPYLLLSNSHDGTQAVRVDYTMIRVVCSNTLEAAHTAGANTSIAIVHRRSVADALKRVQETVDIGNRTFALTIEQFRAMKRQGVSSATLRQYVRHVVAKESRDFTALIDAAMKAQDFTCAETLREERDKEPRAVQQIIDGFEQWDGQKEAGNNLWGAYNAVTYWLEHERGTRNENRLNSSWFGDSKNVRKRAHSEALKLLS